uniref:DDB1- and CUL4-associated factor 11 homolog n=1 Tax=Caenorhabditis tropicalis TaxID=1561998 RepID=A0A1I7UZV9_9PELO
MVREWRRLKKINDLTYIGECDSEHPAARVFGGHVLAQAMSAAYYTAPEGFYVHAVHCYFIRGGEESIPITYNVKIIRDGRNFAIRYVEAVQHGKVIHLAEFSLQKLASVKDTFSLTPEFPAHVPGPDGLVSNITGRHQKVAEGFDARELRGQVTERMAPSLEIRPADLDMFLHGTGGLNQKQYLWISNLFYRTPLLQYPSSNARMGNWIASTLFYSFDLFQRHHRHPQTHFLEYSRDTLNPSVRTAAEIVAHQRMKNRNDSDTDFSDDDEESGNGCPQMTPQEERQMYEREQQIAFSGRCTIGDPVSCTQLRDDITTRCGPRPSTSSYNNQAYLLNRDVQHKHAVTKKTSRAHLLNSHLPNQKRRVDQLRTKNFCAQYVQNGRKLVVSSQDEKIRFYSRDPTRSKYRSRYFQCNELRVDHCNWSILDTAVSQEGDLICYCTWKDAVYVGRLESQAEGQNMTWFPIEWNGDQGQNHCAVFCVRFSDAADQIVCGTSEYSIHVFDVERRRRIRTIVNAHEDDVNTVCFAEAGSNLIYSAGDDGLVKVWDKRAWSDGDVEPVGVFAGHRDGVTYVDSRHDERYLLSNSKDQTIKVWDLRKFSNRSGVSQQWDYRWQPAPPGLCQPVMGDTSVMTLRGHSVLHTLVRAKFSPERTARRYIYTGCARGEVVVYDIVSGTVSRRLKGHQAVVRECDWHPEENEIVSSSWDGVTTVWTWDERLEGVCAPYDHPNISQFGDEDSCDELFQPIKRQQQRKRKTVGMRNAKCCSSSSNL